MVHVIRQSTEAFRRVSFLVSLLALFALGNMVHCFLMTSYQAVLCPVFGRCMWSTGFFRRCSILLGAMLGSTVDTCLTLLDVFLHMFYGEVDSDPEV